MSRLPSPAARLALIVALSVAMAACGGRDRAGSAGPVRVVPQPPGGSRSSATGTAVADTSGDAEAQPRISIDPADTVVSVLNANLDNDVDEEQIIAVKRADDIESPVRLLVADADPARGTYYYESWQSDTSATNGRVFSLAVKDLLGDHGQEIVASGMNEAGKITLDVFRPVAPATGNGLTFKPIFQFAADEISIEESERAESYSTDQKPGLSFPIVATLRDPDSQNIMDLKSISYAWSALEGRYIAGTPVKIPGATVQESQVRALYNSSGEDAFEQFISGSWVNIVQDPKGKQPDTYGAMIEFDTQGRKVALASGNTQEVYLWMESHRLVPNRLWVIGENETVPKIQLRRNFYITVDSVNGITVEVKGEDSGSSPPVKYTRVDDEIRMKLTERPEAQVTMSPIVLTGKYVGQDGLSIDFEGPSLTWLDKNGERNGTYVIFSLGTQTVLTTRLTAPGRTQPEIRTWLVDFKEDKKPTQIVRSLDLSPIQLTVTGYEDANGSPLSLDQTRLLTTD